MSRSPAPYQLCALNKLVKVLWRLCITEITVCNFWSVVWDVEEAETEKELALVTTLMKYEGSARDN
jgi:hypothetical protein